MLCPKCHGTTTCTHTISVFDFQLVRRRRVCTKCGYIFKTFETYLPLPSMLFTKDSLRRTLEKLQTALTEFTDKLIESDEE